MSILTRRLVVAHVRPVLHDPPEDLRREAPEGRKASSRAAPPVVRLRRQHQRESIEVAVRGAADCDTLIDATRLADALILEGCYREARSFSAQQSRVARRVLGPESRDTIYHRLAYAVSLYKDDASRLDEALAIFVDIYQTARRVFGDAHPVTEGVQEKLSEARESQAVDAADAAS